MPKKASRSTAKPNPAVKKGNTSTIMDKIIIHGIYKHFKGNSYIVEDIAYHSETGEKVVVYRALYGDHKLWCRPYDMFLEEIEPDRQTKYGQKHRFELQDIEDVVKEENAR